GGTLEILAEVPLTVGEPFLGLTGAELSFTDTTSDMGNGRVQYETSRFERVFSLVAIDGSRLQGEAHITYFWLLDEFTPNKLECQTSIYSRGPVEWDTVLEGTYSFSSDGNLVVGFTATPPNGPDYTYMSTDPGCPQFDYSSTDTGLSWASGGWVLVNGLYDYHEDYELQINESGEDYYEVHLRWTAP
ncbi:MAG: hypothetical protein Q7R41_01580, partial [Phycisphaerales bacterium]|nr:hypothetical protein [Phycisphaerales bacterium]